MLRSYTNPVYGKSISVYAEDENTYILLHDVQGRQFVPSFTATDCDFTLTHETYSAQDYLKDDEIVHGIKVVVRKFTPQASLKVSHPQYLPMGFQLI